MRAVSDRERQLDLFIPGITDPHLRDVMDVMAYGFLSLSKRRTKPIQYRTPKISILVTANATYGMATIWDWDVIIGLVSMVNEAKNEGQWTGRRIGFRPYDLLHCIGRSTGGANYRELAAAIRRLHFTGITTNIRKDDQNGEERPFSFIEDYRIPERYSELGMGGYQSKKPDPFREWEVTLSPWVYKVVERQNGILAIDRQLFSLRSGIGKFLYRYARKSVPDKTGRWMLSMSKLYELSGACGSFFDFQKKVRQIARENGLPGYRIEVRGARQKGMVYFFKESKLAESQFVLPARPLIDLQDEIPW